MPLCQNTESMITYKRLIQPIIQNNLYHGKVIVLIGARQVGKTTLLKKFFQTGNADTLWLNADLQNVRNRLNNLTLDNLNSLINGKKTVIIDEIQRVKNAGLLLKILSDNFTDIQFIATGSSAFEISDTVFEPLTGRHLLFRLYPFSMMELYNGFNDFELESALSFHLVYGLYPEVSLKKEISENILKNLASQYLYKDVLVWKNIRKPELLEKLLQLLAYQIGMEVSIHELSKQLNIKSETVLSYIDLLEKSFVIFRLKSFSNNPKKELSKMQKIYFWDNGIRNAVIEDFRDRNNRNDIGQLFENMMISDRIKMNSWLKPEVKSYFWRNYNQSEVDYIEKSNDLIKAFEMKYNFDIKHKVSMAFQNMYSDASTHVITSQNMLQFLNLGI